MTTPKTVRLGTEPFLVSSSGTVIEAVRIDLETAERRLKKLRC